MDWIMSIKKIQEARESNRLVIFVGAGVSANSNLPSWKELVQKFAQKINYDKCVKCMSSALAVCKNNKKCNFTQDEMLRIPQYFFQQDNSKNNQDYFQFIQKALKSDNKSNKIDEEIFNILPHHVITTNYDSLLEDSQVVNAQLYTVVAEDKDLLSQASDRYIIKMHGDLLKPETIVLKESDYLDYEQKHPLISTFIRSLLLNHTFLFLGYSLNDYNLNLIIGWINYFCKAHGVDKRIPSFLFTSETPSEFEKLRLGNKSIYVVSAADQPGKIKENITPPNTLEHSAAKDLYRYLRCISDERTLLSNIPLDDFVTNKYEVLKSYSRISYQDLISVLPLGRTMHFGTELVFYDSDWYNRIEKLLDEHNSALIDTFQRGGITSIQQCEKNKCKEIIPIEKQQNHIFELYLQNNYIKLLVVLQKYSHTSEKIYYYTLLQNCKESLDDAIAAEKTEMINSGYITVLLHKMRKWLATMSYFNFNNDERKELEQIYDTLPTKYRRATVFLENMFRGHYRSMHKMEELLVKQEIKYAYKNNISHIGADDYVFLGELQAYAYDYYFFFKENYLPYDFFTDPQDYLSCYMKALLCSYSPMLPPKKDLFGNIYEAPKHSLLGKIEIDMLVKYTKSEILKSWINKYSVSFLEIDSDIEVVPLFENLLKSYACFRNRKWIDQIRCFTILICLIKLNNQEKKSILDITANTLVTNPEIAEDIFEPIAYLVENLFIEDAVAEKGKLINAVLAENIYTIVTKRHKGLFESILKKLSPFVDNKVAENIGRHIDDIGDVCGKCKEIYLFRHVLPMQSYAEYLSSNINSLNTHDVIMLIAEKIIPFHHDIMQEFILTVNKEDKMRKEQPAIRSYPDHLRDAIDGGLYLLLMGHDVDINALKPYAHYSEHLQFALAPEEFDYTKVNTADYMWANFIYSDKYQRYFIEHRNEILTDYLKVALAFGKTTVAQQKIVYGVLMKKEDFYKL